MPLLPLHQLFLPLPQFHAYGGPVMTILHANTAFQFALHFSEGRMNLYEEGRTRITALWFKGQGSGLERSGERPPVSTGNLWAMFGLLVT